MTQPTSGCPMGDQPAGEAIVAEDIKRYTVIVRDRGIKAE